MASLNFTLEEAKRAQEDPNFCGCLDCIEAIQEGEPCPPVLNKRGCECHGDAHCEGPMGYQVIPDGR